MSDIKNAKIEDKIMIALKKQQPRQPIRYELGGGYYYQCPIFECSANINRFMNYCSNCGQALEWSEK